MHILGIAAIVGALAWILNRNNPASGSGPVSGGLSFFSTPGQSVVAPNPSSGGAPASAGLNYAPYYLPSSGTILDAANADPSSAFPGASIVVSPSGVDQPASGPILVNTDPSSVGSGACGGCSDRKRCVSDRRLNALNNDPILGACLAGGYNAQGNRGTIDLLQRNNQSYLDAPNQLAILARTSGAHDNEMVPELY